MKDINYYQNTIKEKRKQTSFRDYLKEITSWLTLVFYKKDGGYISRFPKTNRSKDIHFKEFEKIRDDLVKNGRDYNFSKGFFENYKELFTDIDLPSLMHYGENENSDYTDSCVFANNSYLSNTVTRESDNVAYSFMIREKSVDVLNSVYVVKNNSTIYFSTGVVNSFKIFYSKYINNCSNTWFSTNLTGCKECILCNDLENSSYYIKNKKYEKEEYFILKWHNFFQNNKLA